MQDKEEMNRAELITNDETEEQAYSSVDDVHPYKSRASRNNTVSFPKITKFNTYLLRHYGAAIVEEINSRMYDGELAAICGVNGFHERRLTHNKCRIDPRMSFWRVNKYEFSADLVVYLTANVYDDDTSEIRSFTLYVTLDFCLDQYTTYNFSDISLNRPERGLPDWAERGLEQSDCDQGEQQLTKLDDYLIPIFGFREIDEAAEALWFTHMPEALSDHRLLDPFKLADRMGLSVVYHKLHRNHKTKSVLYWFDSKVEVTPKDGDDRSDPIVVKIPAGTILINENAVQRDHSRLNVYHECFHDEYHWLFFRLQEMHNDDLRKIKKTRKVKNQGKEPKNPLTILEWEAKQGSRALMMPESVIRPMIETYRVEERKTHNHAGFVYENICYSISGKMDIPKYLVKGRMIQLGCWQTQGALNYIRTSETGGHYIKPFEFSHESCPHTSHTFVVTPLEAFRLYEKNEEYRARIDTGAYVYVDGHICLNDPAYVVQTLLGPKMTDWANRHVDECCLRFANVYEVDENYEFRLNSINSDEEYNSHYMGYVAQGKSLSPKEEVEMQTQIIESLPNKPGEAVKALMKLDLFGKPTIEEFAEHAGVSPGTVKNWRKEEYGFDPETAIRIIVGLHLPPWISSWFLQISGIMLQYHGLHMAYREIIACRFMDTFSMVNERLVDAGFDRMSVQG